MLKLLFKVVEKLDNLEIPYVITGSMAMGFHATQRYTKDIDLIIMLKEAHIDKFVGAFEKDFYCYKPAVEEGIKQEILFNLIDNDTGFKIDFIPLERNNEFELNKFEQRINVEIEDKHIWIVSAENLIISKLIWIQELVSEKQILDIENLLLIQDLDREYLNNWIEKLSLKTYNLII